jgi:16S rRNA (cytidine1402-2'-O)-methyltransferase
MHTTCAQSLAMVSDAGMPGISDPGHNLIVAAIEAGIQVMPLPGSRARILASL